MRTARIRGVAGGLLGGRPAVLGRVRSRPPVSLGADPWGGGGLHAALAGSASRELMRLSLVLSLVLAGVGLAGPPAAPAALAEPAASGRATTYYVATSGSDAGPGTRAAPWATVAYAMGAASGVGPGDVVEVAAGVYPGRVRVGVSGEAGRPVVLRAAPGGARPVLDGAGLAADFDGLVTISGQSHLVVDGFEIRGYRSTRDGVEAMGILVDGASAGITLRGNRIHDIGAVTPDPARANAHGILIRGDTDAPVRDVVIEGNELHDLTLGNSEALVLNCNVAGFSVLDNVVRDVDNIGIDVIGVEGGCRYAARDGVVRGNRVERASSCDNPSYGGECSAAGIYVDGGRDVLVERNRVEASDFGIEVASENETEPTRGVVVRSNVLVNNRTAGLAIGGYDRQRAGTADCAVVGNTLVGNGVGATAIGGLYVQFNVTGTVLANNVVVSPAGVPVVYAETEGAGATLDHTLYHAPGGARWERAGRSYTSLADWRAATGGDAASVAAEPRLAADLRPLDGSPVIDAGDPSPCPARPDCLGTSDAAGRARVQGAAPDLGAYERPAGSVASGSAPAASGLVLGPASPNPARGPARLALTVGEASAVRVEVVDALGRRVRVLVDGTVAAGAHPLEVAGLAPGVYTVWAESGGETAARVVTVVR